MPIVDRAVGDGGVDEEWREKLVELVRRTRTHPDVRIGSSVRGASIDATAVRPAWRSCGDCRSPTPAWASTPRLIALSGRIRLREGTTRTAEEIVTELWAEVFGRAPTGKAREKLAPPNGATSSHS